MPPCYEFLYYIQCVYDALHARVCAHIYVIPNTIKKITKKKKVCFKLEQKVRNIKSMFIYMVRKFHVPSN
jgi:hypothetical protein